MSIRSHKSPVGAFIKRINWAVDKTKAALMNVWVKNIDSTPCHKSLVFRGKRRLVDRQVDSYCKILLSMFLTDGLKIILFMAFMIKNLGIHFNKDLSKKVSECLLFRTSKLLFKGPLSGCLGFVNINVSKANLLLD